MPVYNAEKYLDKSIDSVLTQSFQDIELIIVNDGSVDNSLDIIMDYVYKDERVKVIDKINEGVSSARNAGIHKAKGDYIAFVDADDFIDTNMLKNMYEVIEKAQVEVCMCGYVEENAICKRYIKLPWKDKTVLDKNRIKDVLIPGMISSVKKNITYNIIMGSVWRLLIKRESLLRNNIMFCTKVCIGEDLIFCMELFNCIECIITLENCYYHYNRSGYSTLDRYRDNNLEESILTNQKLENILQLYNLMEVTRERLVRKKFSMYTHCISNCFRYDAPKYLKKGNLIENIVKEFQRDPLMKGIDSEQFALTQRITAFLMQHNLIGLLFVCFSIKERIHNIKYRKVYFKGGRWEIMWKKI